LRLVGHGEHDDARYVDPALKSAPLGQDCLQISEAFIQSQGWASAEELATWREELQAEVDETAAKVRREPPPDPAEEEWLALSESQLSDNFAAA